MGAHPLIRERLERQRGVAATWQWRADGRTRAQIRTAVAGMREVHSGVWLSGDAPLTDWQRWKAATLTCEGTVLAGWSGATFVGLRKTDRWPTTVKRVGQGGPRLYAMREGRLGSLLVTFAKDLAADTVEVDEIPVLAPSRIVLGLVQEVSEQAARRFVRDTLRLDIATPAEMQLMLARHPGARSISDYRRYVHEWGELGLNRGKSDAEALAIAAATRSPDDVLVRLRAARAKLNVL